ncbi:MAG: DNA double-strand break repair nuclease NurA [Thermofilaceae archaeon]|nr:DNA double-strand break repair nuclease NurA [Thermofilaceae archaeon]
MAFSNVTLSTVESVIKKVEERVKSLANPIEGEQYSSVGFVDGSYVMDERRGVYVLALSAATILVEGGRMEGLLKGSSRPQVTVLIPKSFGEARASLLMSILELLGALDLVNRGVQAVFLDGSYVSELMVPFGHPRDAYENFTSTFEHKVDGILDKWGKAVEKASESAPAGEPLSAFSSLLKEVNACACELYTELVSSSDNQVSKKEALDFSFVFCESTAFLALLDNFLAACRNSSIYPYWVAKDAESRYVVEREGVEGWLNDLTLLDYSWKELDYAYTELEGKKLHRPKPCAVWEPILGKLYENWGENRVSYFKLAKVGPVSQMTYPRFAEGGAARTAVATLLTLADKRGYPRPLSYVHHIAVLNPELAKLLADELYRRENNPIVKYMLAPSGRVSAGLR